MINTVDHEAYREYLLRLRRRADARVSRRLLAHVTRSTPDSERSARLLREAEHLAQHLMPKSSDGLTSRLVDHWNDFGVCPDGHDLRQQYERRPYDPWRRECTGGEYVGPPPLRDDLTAKMIRRAEWAGADPRIIAAARRKLAARETGTNYPEPRGGPVVDLAAFETELPRVVALLVCVQAYDATFVETIAAGVDAGTVRVPPRGILRPASLAQGYEHQRALRDLEWMVKQATLAHARRAVPHYWHERLPGTDEALDYPRPTSAWITWRTSLRRVAQAIIAGDPAWWSWPLDHVDIPGFDPRRYAHQGPRVASPYCDICRVPVP